MPSWLNRVPGNALHDSNWVRQTFLLSGEDVGRSRYRTETLAKQKFTSARLGGNWTINNPPQFTRYADPRETGLSTVNDWFKNQDTQRLGMGHYYSEAIDDTRQEIAMQFGVPEYNGMLTFFTGFYDNETAVMSNEGLGVIGYYIGRVAGLIIGLPVLPLIWLGQAARFFLGRPSSKYYYMRETMPLYWNRVNTIANGIALNMGLVPKIELPFNAAPSDGATPELDTATTELRDKGYVDYFSREDSDIFLKGGGIDVYAMANATQRMADKRYDMLVESLGAEGEADAIEIAQRVRDHQKTQITPPEGQFVDKDGNRGARAYMENYLTTRAAINGPGRARSYQTDSRTQTDVSQIKQEQPAGGTPEQTAAAEAAAKPTPMPGLRPKWDAVNEQYTGADAASFTGSGGELKQKLTAGLWGGDDTFADFYMADRRDGSKFVRFRVDNGGAVSESFSNSTGESSIQSTINSTSGSARNARFTFSDGNTGVGVLDTAINGLKGIVQGTMDSLQVTGLMSLAGSAFLDIPKTWQSSSADLPSTRYTMELRTPYGNHMSRFINLFVPLACLLAGALPLSTGKQSYTSPFLCQLWHRGHAQVRLGMIDSLSIQRGTGGLGWNINNECLAIDVSFSVVDLSTIMHAPIDTGFSILRPWRGLLQDQDDPFNDYLAILGNLSMADQIYTLRKAIRNLTRKANQVDAYFTQAHAASMMDEMWPTRWVGKTISAVVRGSEGAIGVIR